MKPTQLPLDSDALRANIGRTAQKVVIPDRYLPLIEAVEGLYGVRTPLIETLLEYFHSYRNVDSVIEGFQTTLLRNWTYFERSPKRAELFALLADLVLDLAEKPLTGPRFSLLLRQLLTWCAAALKGTYGESYDDPLCDIGARLAPLLEMQPVPFLERDALLRDVVAAAQTRPAVHAAFAGLYRAVLLLGYRRAVERLDIIGWATAAESPLTDAAAVAERFGFLAVEHVNALADAAQKTPATALISSEHPTFSELLERTTDTVFRVEDLEDRFAVCLYFLKDDTLGYRQNEVMADLLGVVKQLLNPQRRADVEKILARLTRFFRDRDNQFLLMRFQCYEAIGVAIGEAGNLKAADRLMEDIFSWRFQYPQIEGATDDWETIVNPFHLPKIRCWMHIIESNPALYERLAAALNLQLRLGGVYIADTDLFQRDVTRFLNADIRPIYFVAKQLLRTLPVYFNEVGAEGELRSVSTEIDELCGRRDTLMHFLRKQSHTESSNRLVDFSREVLRYWLTRDLEGLSPFLSANTMAAVEREAVWADGPHALLTALRERLPVSAPQDSWDREQGGDGFLEEPREDEEPSEEELTDAFLDRLLSLPPAALAHQLEPLNAGDGQLGNDALHRRRVSLMVRMHQLLANKYSLSAAEIGAAVDRHTDLEARLRDRFDDALTHWQANPSAHTRDRLLDAALAVLEELKSTILSEKRSTATENIYQKRHIAAGIPSIYGNYSEPKFDALGLTFRLENLVATLFDDIIAEGSEPYVTRDTLRRMYTAMRRLERALAVDGADSRALHANLDMLEASFSMHNFSFHQYQNVFQFIVNSVAELSTTATLSHEQVLHTVLTHDPRQCEARHMSVDAVAELVLRDVLVSALGMQALDRYAGAALRQISMLHGRLSSQALTRMMNYDPERLVSPIDEPKPAADDQVNLGFKGLGLKEMALYGHRVPEGFILSHELFSARPAMSYRPLYDDTIQRIRTAVAVLERQTGLRLGDRRRPLLLSIRSGAAISLPGLMSTFVNVGLNDQLAEAAARRPGFAWAVWDGYRRFLQSWAMSAGIDRDFFDEIMNDFKRRFGVQRKLDFTADQMRDMAFAYKDRAREGGVVFVQDPFSQVVSCVFKVLESWDSQHTRLYRQYLGIAEEWGTSVVVQRMVFGNLSRESGSGVVFTHNPLEPYSRQVRLFGDFAVRSQGEDVVGGLVFPWPISEAQRLASPTYNRTEHSLERDFPEIYWELLSVARDLVGEREFDPQEIEFTFESPLPRDLYVLQKRAVVQDRSKDAPYFDTASPNYGTPVAVGMGVAQGAYSGRVAVNAEQIDQLLAEDPDEKIVLLRPDTVPEDIAIISRVDAILTARGGATSHAAVTAKRLGKTAVVDCMELEVVEHTGSAQLAGRELRAGDWLSIDGRTGNIFLGRIPTRATPP